jgi:hypothetical protein
MNTDGYARLARRTFAKDLISSSSVAPLKRIETERLVE